MMRKIFGVKSISHLIYGLLILAPILAIGVKCGYVMLNKNAKDSYSGANGYQINYKYETNEVNQASDLKSGNIYSITIENAVSAQQYASYFYAVYNVKGYDVSIDVSREENQYIVLDLRPTYVAFRSSAYVGLVTISDISYPFTFDAVLYQYNVTTDFNYQNFSETDFNIIDSVDISNQGTLDNVFYYAIDEIIQDNNFGKINFTGWFDNMMLDNNIQINQTYTHLFNWYLNYTLFISCAYILWLVLMWFVNFARKLLDRGMNYDW